MTARVLLCCCLAFAASLARGADSDAEANARKAALDLAGAFSNEGFKMRDGHWSGEIKPHAPALIAVNLYAGNQYWFSAGAEAKAKKLGIKVFDESGKAVTSEPYEAESRAAAGFSPTMSGQYFVALEIVEGEPAACCLMYSYK